MGPGPVGVDPRVLRAMSMPMLGQFDPAFTAYMNETMALTAPALPHPEPMVAAGRRHRARRHRGHPGVADLARRQGAGADLRPVRPSARRNRRALRRRGRHHRARMGHGVHAGRDRDRNQAAPAAAARGGARRHLDHDGAAARRDRRDVPASTTLLYSDATATLGGMHVASMRGSSMRSAPACRNACPARPARRRSRSTSAVAEIVKHRKHLEAGIKPAGLRRRQRAAHPVELFRSRAC